MYREERCYIVAGIALGYMSRMGSCTPYGFKTTTSESEDMFIYFESLFDVKSIYSMYMLVLINYRQRQSIVHKYIK